MDEPIAVIRGNDNTNDDLALQHAKMLLLLRLIGALTAITSAAGAVVIAYLVAIAEHAKLF